MRAATCMSASDGSSTPDGWLWTSISPRSANPGSASTLVTSPRDATRAVTTIFSSSRPHAKQTSLPPASRIAARMAAAALGWRREVVGRAEGTFQTNGGNRDGGRANFYRGRDASNEGEGFGTRDYSPLFPRPRCCSLARRCSSPFPLTLDPQPYVFNGFFLAAGNSTLLRISRYPGELLCSDKSVGGLPIPCCGSSGS